MGHPARKRATVADYLDAHDGSEQKLELVDGQIVAMTGGSYRHAELIERIYLQLATKLGGRPCRPHSSEKRFRSPLFRNIRYPDGMVTCGEIAFDDEDPQAITNPVAVFEVLSDSTEGLDRGDKAAEYRSTPAVRHLVLISARWKRVEVFTRQDDDRWVLEEATRGALPLSALEIDLDLDELYDGLDITEKPHPPRDSEA